jgi:Predicted membrane protein
MRKRLKKIISRITPIVLLTSLCIGGIPIQKVRADTNTWNYGFIAQQQTFTAPYTGSYTLEAWGASGGGDGPIPYGGKGGYAKGNITLNAGQTIYIYTGGQGASNSNSTGGGWNGGGNAGAIGGSGGGGGATDIRFNGTALSNRILVAGGGGGSGCVTAGANGGGITGDNATNGGYGGTQSSGGSALNGGQPGILGQGGNDPVDGGGGGGGYFGGGSGGQNSSGDYGGGGGSSYVGGVSGGSTTSGVNTGNGYIKVTYKNPILNVNANTSTNSIDMSWSVADTSQSYSYMLYSKSPNDSSFQTIPAKSSIRVLNVYPENTTMSAYKDSNGNFIPMSALLKTWMETNGYGKSLINVDEVYIDTFNNSPSTYLGTSSNWKYDVVMFGSWDSYNGKDLNATSEPLMETFIKSGRGVLFGHDTIKSDTPTNYFASLKGYVNEALDNNYWSTYDHGNGTSVKVSKKGLLTNYPWNIGDVGTVLTIPLAHTVGQIPAGDIWLRFTNVDDANISDAYLTTWNNTAQIQTGHSNGQATVNEQQIIANTLFYLGQVTTDTTWSDHKGQDVANPNGTNITGISTNSANNQFTINYNPVTDNGSTYQYYVEATGSSDNAKLRSETKTSTITSGIKGYSIIVDQSSSTVVSSNNITTNSTNYTFNKPYSSNFYVHIASVDNAGNISGTTTSLVDNTAPTLTITPSTTAWTNGNVTLTATGLDSNSAMKSITLPNNNVVNGGTATYIVGANGNYTFVATDNVGNNTTNSITVSNIDTTGATLNLSENTTSWAKQVTINASASDTQSGVKSITLPNGTVINGASASYPVTANGTYQFVVIDNVGNITTKSITVNNVDTTAPGMTFTQSTNQITNQSVTITATASDNQSGVATIKLPDGTFVNGSTANYTVTSSGSYTFQTTDSVGNSANYSFVVSNIIVISTVSDIDHIEYKLDGATVQNWTTYTGAFNVVNEGITTVSARAIDKAGNISDIATSVVKIDRSKPINGTIQIIIK